MVEAAAAVDYSMREKLIDAERWLVYGDNGIDLESCGCRSVWCECVWVCVIYDVIFSHLWDN